MLITLRSWPAVLTTAVLTVSGDGLIGAAAAGQASPPGTRVIVRALTAAGEPITDLKKEEVSVRTDGRQREVTDLTMIRISGESPTAKGVSPSSLPPPYATSSATAAPAGPADAREFLILLDEEGIATGREQPVRDALNQLISRLTPRDRVGVVGLRIGGMNVAPTANHDSVKTAIGKMPAEAQPARQKMSSPAGRRERSIPSRPRLAAPPPAARSSWLPPASRR